MSSQTSSFTDSALSDKVKFVPGIALMAQSGSVRSIDSVNFYQTNVRTGICRNLIIVVVYEYHIIVN